MKTRSVNNIKLGIFVLIGLLVFILALYMIGRNSNLFGRNYELKARFDNVQGLTIGNNVRYSGIQVGTVKQIAILDDTLIEVTFLINDKMKSFIHKTDIVSIGTDGLMGNKLINIAPAKDNSTLAEEGDILVSKQPTNTGEMLETLDKTNRNLVIISEEIKQTVQRINASKALWKILDDQTLPQNLKASLIKMRDATARADAFVSDLQTITNNVREGKGSLGRILVDTAIAYNLNQTITKIQKVAGNANQLADELTLLTGSVKHEINNGKGAINALLKDSTIVIKLNNSLSNIEQGTESFNEDMEALKHNILLRGFFKKQEKEKKKEAAKSSKPITQ